MQINRHNTLGFSVIIIFLLLYNFNDSEISVSKDHSTDHEISEPLNPNALSLTLRSREEIKPDNVYQVVQREEIWDPSETAIIIADMWDQHWCEGSAQRVDEMAPYMNDVVVEARRKGVMIIHAPSGTLDFYEGTTQRDRAIQATYSEPPFELESWCYLDPDKESNLPIDDSDGGCDTEGEEGPPWPWTRQVSTIDIETSDIISDNGVEVYNIFQEQGIQNLIVMGVHTNMCVLGRSFAIRQMVNLGINVVLMRDMTDTMYNPEMPPYVTHFRGTELVVEHIEKYWAPTILSTDITGEPAFRFAEDERTHIAFVIAEDEYDAHLTLPAFAEQHLSIGGKFAFNFIQSDNKAEIDGIKQIRDADLLILFVRRRHLSESQLDAVRDYLNAGKPLIALRTSSHAFETWTKFDPEVLGGNYSGHYGNRPPADPPTWVQVASGVEDHPVVADLPNSPFRAASWLYKTRPLVSDATPLMFGWVGADGEPEPVSWVRNYGEAKIFYTSLGESRDFEDPVFNQLLKNAIKWAIKDDINE